MSAALPVDRVGMPTPSAASGMRSAVTPTRRHREVAWASQYSQSYGSSQTRRVRLAASMPDGSSKLLRWRPSLPPAILVPSLPANFLSSDGRITAVPFASCRAITSAGAADRKRNATLRAARNGALMSARCISCSASIARSAAGCSGGDRSSSAAPQVLSMRLESVTHHSRSARASASLAPSQRASQCATGILGLMSAYMLSEANTSGTGRPPPTRRAARTGAVGSTQPSVTAIS
eukprot:scaffold1182_cov124-Isochrysis_galbana.AAC.16